MSEFGIALSLPPCLSVSQDASRLTRDPLAQGRSFRRRICREQVVTLLIQAVQHVRRMRGGAQSHLMRCADGHYYVVKFQNNPQHTRVLVNDWLGTRLGEMIGLPVPVPAIVDVHPWLVEHTPDLRMELCGRRTMFTAGAVVRLALCGFAAGRAGLRLPAGDDDSPGAQPARLCRHSGTRQMDLQCQRAPGGVLEEVARAQTDGHASSTRAIASMPGSGAFRMRRCAGCSGATTCTCVSHRGIASSRG